MRELALKQPAAEACRILGLDPERVTALGFALEAIGCDWCDAQAPSCEPRGRFDQ